MAAEGSFRLFGKMIQVGKEMEQKVSIAQEAGTKEEEDTGEKSTAAASALPEKPAKRPAKDDGIPCPRCRSRDTKFCYYNNYNANQPRHFCRSCQRYWTAGGAMRNVPVGAGRRRSKGLRAAVPPEASQADAGNAKVLSFTVGNYPTHHAAPAGPTCFWTGPCDQSPPPPILPSSPPPLPPTWTVDFDGGSRPGRWEERRGPVPETLRIDRHAEAAGIGMMGVVLFRSKKESKCQELGVRSFSHVMSSNPAAFSRSLNFQESI